ncbi:hypothetical protein [Caulobacter hibisci]|uniref:Uncharacterized protein n=1 Tax=Caulobacter hibisci TaxID=2035993 RepID=A0ABS0SS55_9CAUL|nr:hypothetical protein [Caulobacter hibisci]MBI1682429.1 hypothetical protein [Caulobacter hibisci]
MTGRSMGAAALAVALAGAPWSGAALAQVDPGALRDRNAARMEIDSLRQDQLASARRVQAARDRAAAGAAVHGLATAPASPRPLRALPERGDPAAAQSLRLDELDRLTDARLARSNAAIRAIKPASER